MKPIRSVEPTQMQAVAPEFDDRVLLAAAREAVRQALAQHKSRGNPVVVWRDGRVVMLPPEEIEV